MRTSSLRLVLRLSAIIFLFAGLQSSSALWATTPDMDFGLPLFGAEEIRLERNKAPEFNLHLVKKFLGEQTGRPLHRLHAMAHLANLVRLSDEEKARELRTRARAMFRPASLENATDTELLQHLFLEGLLLAHLGEGAGKAGNADKPGELNVPDKEFEKILFACEEKLGGKPEYHLTKGILFILLRNRPNGFFAPMKPLEDLKRAATLAPKEPQFQFVLGQAFRMLGTEENTLFFAILCYEKAGALAPGNARLHHTLLSLYMSLHESYQGTQRRKEPFWLEEAVYKKILTLSPNNPHAQNNLGYLYAEYGVHRNQAQQLCQQAVDQMPNNPGFRDSLGWAAFKNGKYDKAETEMLAAIKMMPESYDAHYHLGTLYYVTKKVDKAITMYEKAVTFQPTSAEALNNYAYLLAEHDRDLDKAHDMSLRATRLEPDNASYLDTLGWIEFRKGNSREALRLLKKAVNLAPDVGEILSHVGQVHLEMKEFESAISFLNQALKADPTQDNLQHDLYLAISLRAIHRAIADYHRLFGPRANPQHLMGFMLQLARLYQEEGQFSSAIAANQLCEKLKRNEIDLGQPLFDFYTIDPASLTPAVAGPALEPPTADGDETELATASPSLVDSAASAPTVFPPVYRSCLALHFGPALFQIIGKYFPLDPEFSHLSCSVFLPSLSRPMQHVRIQFELPGLDKRNVLGVFENYLGFFGCQTDRQKTPIPGYPGFTTTFGKRPLWAFQVSNRMIVGLGEPVTMDEIASLSETFPVEPDAVIGFLIDWPTIEEQLPQWIRPFLGNPLHPYFRILGRYRRDGVILRETALLEPVSKIDRGFMQNLAADLFAYKMLLMKIGMKVAIRVEANDGCVRLSADYGEIPRLLRTAVARANWLAPLYQPRLQSWLCLLRRSACTGKPADLQKLCPNGGTVSLAGDTGLVHCSYHHDQGAYPLPIQAADRCRISRSRLEDLLKRFFPRTPASPENEGLLEKLRMDYNVSSCPAGGVLSRDSSGRVICPLHAD